MGERTERRKITSRLFKKILDALYDETKRDDSVKEFFTDNVFNLGPMLYYCEFTNIDFGSLGHHRKIAGINFTGSLFKNCKFEGLLIQSCNFSDCTFAASNFILCCFDYIYNFHDSIFHKCVFENSQFSKRVHMQHCRMYDCIFCSCLLTHTMTYGLMNNINFIDSNIGGVFSGVKFVNQHQKDSELLFSYTGNFFSCDFSSCDIEDTFINDLPMACPSEGEFIGWKACMVKIEDEWHKKNGISNFEILLVKLLIPEDAKRSSAMGIKCRCDKAKVLGIYTLDGKICSLTSILSARYTTIKDPVKYSTEKVSVIAEGLVNRILAYTEYTVGEMVYADSFDDCRWNECSNGIHFYMDRKYAKNHFGETKAEQEVNQLQFAQIADGKAHIII